MKKIYTLEERRRIAKFQKLVLWSVLANILSIFIVSAIPRLGILISLSLIIFQIYSIYNLGKALKLSMAWIVLFLIGLFIPLVGLLCLLSINSQATKALQDAGVKVGLMGANPDEIRG